MNNPELEKLLKKIEPGKANDLTSILVLLAEAITKMSSALHILNKRLTILEKKNGCGSGK